MAAPFPAPIEPHPGLLLAKLARQVDEAMLRDIAEADYAQQANEHYAVLRRMRDEGFVPMPEWVPQEVLELIRWSQPDQPGWMPGGQGERGHWMRAFCCASLLRMAGEKGMRPHVSFNETTVALVASLDTLNAGLWAETGALLNWFIDRLAMERDRGEEPFIGVALLYCALHVAAVPDPSITALCRWTIDREQEEAFGPMGAANDGGWLHRISHHDQRRETWRTVGRRMASLDLSFRSVELREWVALIATSLAEDS